jgi:hypothetical protein
MHSGAKASFHHVTYHSLVGGVEMTSEYTLPSAVHLGSCNLANTTSQDRSRYSTTSVLQYGQDRRPVDSPASQDAHCEV